MSKIFTITSGWNSHRISLLIEQASSKTHFQPVQSSFLHYELVFYSIPKEGNCGAGKVVVASQNQSQKASSIHVQHVRSSFLALSKLVFYKIAKERNFVRRKVRFCLQRAIFGLR